MRFLKREKRSTERNFLGAVLFYGAWGLTAVLLVPMLGQLKTVILYLALRLIENDALRPPGWNTGTLVGVDKCTTFLALGAWLILFLYAETHIREAQLKNRFYKQTGKMLLIIAGVWLAGVILLLVV